MIRRVAPAEWQQLRDVRLAALAADPSAFGSTLDRELGFAEQRWQDWPENQACFVAAAGDAVVGMVTGVALSDVDAELNALWVAPESRGTGLGTGLIRAVIGWAQESGRQRLLLWVTSGNAAGLRVYEAAGFTPTSEEKPLPSDPQLTEMQYEFLLR